MVGGVAATAAVRTWPFRVYSFPQEIKLAHWYDDLREFDISRVPPAWIDPELSKQIITTGFIRLTGPAPPLAGLMFEDHLAQLMRDIE